MSDTAPRDPLLMLVAYADGELDAATTTAIELLLAGSSDLRNRLEDVRSLQAGLRAKLPAAPRELDYTHRRTVMQAAKPLGIHGWWTTARVVAAAVLVFGVTFGALAMSSLTVYSTKGPVEEPQITIATLTRDERGRGTETYSIASPAPSSPTAMGPNHSSFARDLEARSNKPARIEMLTMPLEGFSREEEHDADRPKAREETKADSQWGGAQRSKDHDGEKAKESYGSGDGAGMKREVLNKQVARLGGDEPQQQAVDRNDLAAGRETIRTTSGFQVVGGGSGAAQGEPALRQAERAEKALEQLQKSGADALQPVDGKSIPTWHAPLNGADLASNEVMAQLDSGGMPIDDALEMLGQTDQVMAMQQAQQRDDNQPTVSLDLDRLSRGQALLQTARAGGRQLRPLPDGVEVAPDRHPLDPTETFGLAKTDFQSAFGTLPMSLTAESAKLTFAFTADTASFDRARSQLLNGETVDPLAIRAEHFVNAVPSDYPPVSGNEAFALYAEAGPSPFAAGSLAPRTALVSVGALARPAGADERRPLALTLAIDCSGSMAQPGGLDRVRAGIHELLARLGDDDSVAVVAFGDRARVVLPATPGSERTRIAAAIAAIQTGGSTNAGEGLNLAYQLAAENAKPGRESRVLLATDGATLAGDGATPVLERIAADRARGITLVVVGCGGQHYEGAALDALAAKGDGQHLYVGSDDEARALFRDKLVPARLGVLARDAKVQVTWNPQRVTHARLIGFETRRLNDNDFRNNAIDAGELANDSQATALFEVVLVDGGTGALGTAAVRYLDTRLGTVRELACPLPGSLVKTRPSQRLRLMACSATLADLLGRTWWANQRCATYAGLLDELNRCQPSPFRDELLNMAAQARQITREP